MTEKKLTLEERYHRHVAKQPYTFPWAGRDWTLPHMASLDYRLQNKISKFESLDMDELEKLFERMIPAEQRAAWADADVPGDFLPLVFEEWLEYSGDALGEDSASSESSTNTGASSRRTSAGSTTSGSRRSSSAKKTTPQKRPAKKAAPTTVQLPEDSLPGNS